MATILKYIAESIWPSETQLRRDRFYLLVAALLLAMAWPPLPLGFLALIALIIPLDIISGLTFKAAFKKAYFYSFFYFLFSLYWISWVTVPGALAAMGLISLYSALVFGLYASIYRRWKNLALILLPFFWVGVEYFRTLSEVGFPWSNLSYTQGSYLPFIQIMEFTGDAGISFIIVVVNILLWQIWRNPKRRFAKALIVGLLIVLPTIYGSIVMRSESNINQGEFGDIRIALLQGDMSIEDKWNPDNREYNFKLYDSLSMSAVAADSSIDLLIWPETALPVYLLSSRYLTMKVSRSAQKANRPLLTGTLDYDSVTLWYYNAALQFDADGSHQPVFHKTKLVPFAETVPYSEYIPWLANLSLGWSDFEHGKNLQVFENDFGSYGVLICYEVIFPELVRDYVNSGVDFMVNITNDTWYGWSSGPFQHAGMTPFRAIENRIPIARAANSGYSYFVDKYGRMYNKSRLYQRTIQFGNLTFSDRTERTVYSRYGSILGKAGLLIIIALSFIFIIVWQRERILNTR